MGSAPILLAEAATVIAAMGLAHYASLLVRDPHRPAWLRGPWGEPAVGYAVVILASMAMALLIVGLVRAGIDVLPAFALALGLAGASWWGLWRAFAVGARLERAQAGLSPWRLAPVPGHGDRPPTAGI